jgi:hypothetical protein
MVEGGGGTFGDGIKGEGGGGTGVFEDDETKDGG